MFNFRIKDVEFTSPIILSSGTYGYGNEMAGKIDFGKLGGIVTKSLTLNPLSGNEPPRLTAVGSGILNAIGLANIGVRDFVKSKLPILNKLPVNIIVRS